VDVHVSAERELEQLCTLQTSTACADEHASEPATGVSCSRPVVATIAVERGRARVCGPGRLKKKEPNHEAKKSVVSAS